jgi:hypothetical protein
MSFNRLNYDNCAYAKTLQESTSPLEYNLFMGKYENKKQCPEGKFTNNLPFGPKTDVESELWGITRLQSRCEEKKYDPANPGAQADFTPARVCDTIYYITPTNMKMPTSNGFDNRKLGGQELSNLPKTNPLAAEPVK